MLCEDGAGLLVLTGAPEPTGAQSATLVAPQRMRFGGAEFELTVHRPSRLLLADIELVFRPDLAHAHKASGAGYPSRDAFLRERVLLIPLWQPATQDLSVISPEVSAERRQLCMNFVAWIAAVRAQLGGHWLDASDPRSGQAMFGTPTTATYNELDGLTQCLKYHFEPFGCCGIVIHPQWRYNAYPVTVFTTAPLLVLQAAIEAAAASVAAGALAPAAHVGAIADVGGDECA
ncbi:hypothetical protein T492DRAFT_1093502 [Pavlovales sp. CCMP2436]|nr:hypothetical protein T492DRAFT_1093502 [Pavlovales sp. CCMP2436]